MREIKFRVWDIDTNTMYHNVISATGYPIYIDADNWIPQTRLDGSLSAILMQFTGLKDKNGNEIYEGDIVKDESGYLAPVKWISTKDEWDYDGWSTDDFFLDSTVEIIGNIYENPELI